MGAITGPVSIDLRGYTPQGHLASHERRLVYKQKPINRAINLPYKALFCETSWMAYEWWNVLSATGDYNYVMDCFNAGTPSADWDTIVNEAYEDFISNVHATAALGQNLAERKQAVNMIAHRCRTLAYAFGALRVGHFKRFLAALDVPPKRRHTGVVRVRSRQASALWLEYHFGWSPMLQDIYGAIQILDAPVPYGRAVGKKSSVIRRATTYRTYDFRAFVKIGADVAVSNASAYQANQFGVLNPASIAWELIPFSFLVDWFMPIGNYLRSYTDFLGLSVENGFHTKFLKGKGTYGDPYSGTLGETRSVFMERNPSIPGPVITLNIPTRLSISKAVTSISLLISLFINGYKK